MDEIYNTEWLWKDSGKLVILANNNKIGGKVASDDM